MMDNNRPLLEIRDLKVTFPHGKNAITAVDSISFSVDRGTTLGIVGESGSGKSTVARAVMQLIAPNSGEILFDGQNLTKMSKSEIRDIRKRTQMVFQDPGGSLNEYMQVGKIIAEPLLVHGIAKGKELQKRAEELLNQVGLEPKDAKRYPHEFSGGQKQRIAIARSIAIHPELLVCDEPTSALDVTVQAKILKLLSNLRDELGLTILFISHDLAVINEFCSKVLVMANGKIVESGAVNDVIQNPTHEITKELIASSYA
ncbi:MAG TPA: ABC transporter ATP-binding protein [Phycisphaerales bacterium]|nr:ABC transporter ATP-binding protein [Phycisphaerales bacterium]HIB01438.1 ABC transporter ATP-binding protein [Phycisphaerales bacterium]HIB51271.1 ABC transporter ATP-binding protein [Phycisphaerales bacterium]HIN84599.1 ABC transporter ATP-binding protein [Phycisphaerales bacterium]HIO20441.1 ABC transporter ATP-binding protein [Phycisphaerales bacterium]